MTDLYAVLGIPVDANDQQIKTAYRKLSLKYHPDKNPNGTETFQQINKANEILSNPQKRRYYDRWGEDGLKLLENNFADGNLAVDDQSTFVKWGQVSSIYFGIFLFDYFTGIPGEWLFCIFYSIYFPYRSKLFKAINYKLLGIFFATQLVLYFLLPTSYLIFISSTLLYISLLMYANSSKTAWDITTGIFVLVLFIDIYWSRVPIRWTFLASYSACSSGVAVLLFLLHFNTSLIPEAYSSYSVDYAEKLLMKFIRSDGKLSLISLLFWCLLWWFDGLIGIGIEWLPFSFLLIVQLFSWPWYGGIIFAVSVIFVYYILPVAFVVKIANAILYLLSLSLLRYSTFEEDYKTNIRTELKKLPKLYYGVLSLLVFIEFFVRSTSSYYWYLTACISFCWSIFLVVLAVLSELVVMAEEAEKKSPSPVNKKR